jgi:hypothetical protein
MLRHHALHPLVEPDRGKSTGAKAAHKLIFYGIVLRFFMLKPILAALLIAAAADAAAHKRWMNDASDAQEDLRDAVTAKSPAKASAAAMKIDSLMSRTEGYWAEKKAADIVALARESRELARRTAMLAKAGKFDEANASFTKLGATCNACHDKHPERR